MKAMVLRRVASMRDNDGALDYSELPDPQPNDGELLLRVTACGVCHTELDEIEGRVAAKLPVIPGHQVVGVIEGGTRDGERVGVAWIGGACGRCSFCLAGSENLCPDFVGTGRDINGGFAEYMSVRADFVHPIPQKLTDAQAAPLLCAGAVGFRALRLCNLSDGEALGLFGFGGSNHLVLKIALHQFPHSDIFVFTRNPNERSFALSLGAKWAGDLDAAPPRPLDAALDTTPVWRADLEALKQLRPGGRLIINAIRKSDDDRGALAQLDYASQLWMEKEIKTVANVTRADVREFLQIASQAGIKPEYEEYALADANRALLEMQRGMIRGSKVLIAA